MEKNPFDQLHLPRELLLELRKTGKVRFFLKGYKTRCGLALSWDHAKIDSQYLAKLNGAFIDIDTLNDKELGKMLNQYLRRTAEETSTPSIASSDSKEELEKKLASTQSQMEELNELVNQLGVQQALQKENNFMINKNMFYRVIAGLGITFLSLAYSPIKNYFERTFSSSFSSDENTVQEKAEALYISYELMQLDPEVLVKFFPNQSSTSITDLENYLKTHSPERKHLKKRLEELAASSTLLPEELDELRGEYKPLYDEHTRMVISFGDLEKDTTPAPAGCSQYTFFDQSVWIRIANDLRPQVSVETDSSGKTYPTLHFDKRFHLALTNGNIKYISVEQYNNLIEIADLKYKHNPDCTDLMRARAQIFTNLKNESGTDLFTNPLVIRRAQKISLECKKSDLSR